jgi:hypothetical protein
MGKDRHRSWQALVIVSHGKAKTINKYLGRVQSHRLDQDIQDLPKPRVGDAGLARVNHLPTGKVSELRS